MSTTLRKDWPPTATRIVLDAARLYYRDMNEPFPVPEVCMEQALEAANTEIERRQTEIFAEAGDGWIRRWESGKTDPEMKKAIEATYDKLRGAERGLRPRRRGHATKKSAAQLDREIAEALGRFPYDDPALQAKWRVEPSELRVGQRFNHFGQLYEIIKIGRDKERTIQIARRSSDPFDKESLIDHRSFPMRAFYQQHLEPVRGAR